MNKAILFFFFCTSANLLSYSQGFFGAVVDSATHTPIPFVNIYEPNLEIGTIANSEGQFEIDSPLPQIELIFSHIGFQSKKVLVQKSKTPLRILLSPHNILLPELAVSDEGYKTAKKALAKLQSSTIVHFGKAFYRQVTVTGENPSEFYETFNDISFTSSGIEKFDPYQSRYARARQGGGDSLRFFFDNFSYLTFAFKLFTTEHRDVAKPFSAEYFDDFDFSIKYYFESENNRYAVVQYEPLPELQKPAFFGDMVVNLASGSVVNFTASTKSNLGLDSVTVKRKGVVKKTPVTATQFTWKVTFTESDKETSLSNLVTSCTVNFPFDEKEKTATVLSMLSVFEKDSKRKKGLKEPNIRQVDIEKIRKTKYSPRFWKDNPVIKRTHFEDEIISFFEKSNSFSNYLK